ncbi:MAG: MFS transporter [Verrucomicrobia subdivision 3 bacterium]|nr:MFS transporter [Limisphaerales bacterium]
MSRLHQPDDRVSRPESHSEVSVEGISLLQSLKALPRPVWILCLGTFLNKFGAFVIPFLALYLTRQGFSVKQAGLALMSYGAGHVVATAMGGHLADTIGRRNTIVLSMFSAAICMLLLSQARSYTAILVLTASTGLACELYRPACNALLADLVAPAQRITAYSAYRLALNAGFAFGPATAGLLVEHSFFWLFVGDAFSSFLFGAVALALLPHGLRSRKEESGWTPALISVRGNLPFLQLLIASLLIGPVVYQMASTFGLHVTNCKLPAWVYGVLISGNGILVVLFELPLTRITSRLPPRRVLAAGYVLLGAGFAMNTFATTVPLLAIVIVVITFGEMLAMPVSIAYSANLAPAAMRGRYMGVYGSSWSISVLVGPMLGMTLFSYQPALLWAVCGALGLLAAAAISLQPASQPV